MGKIRDPRLVGTPKNEGERMALNALQTENAMTSNPLFGVVQALEGEVKKLAVQYRTSNIRTQALLDYMAHLGLILHQDIDDEGNPASEAYTPVEQEIQLFEKLVEAGIIDKMPTYGFSAFYVEHNARVMFLVEVMGAVQKGIHDMEKAIALIDEFNNVPDRIVPISGTEFGLDVFLTENPLGWEEEKCKETAVKFGLVMKEDIDEKQAGEGTEETVVPFKRPSETEGNDEG